MLGTVSIHIHVWSLCGDHFNNGFLKPKAYCKCANIKQVHVHGYKETDPDVQLSR